MELNEELLKQLQEAILNLGLFNYLKDGLTIDADSTDNTLSIKIEYKEDNTIQNERDNFVKYLESLDDDLFVEICEGLDVTKIQNCLYSNDIDSVRSAIFKFKSHADEVINDKIEYLTSCLSKLHK